MIYQDQLVHGLWVVGMQALADELHRKLGPERRVALDAVHLKLRLDGDVRECVLLEEKHLLVCPSSCLFVAWRLTCLPRVDVELVNQTFNLVSIGYGRFLVGDLCWYHEQLALKVAGYPQLSPL